MGALRTAGVGKPASKLKGSGKRQKSERGRKRGGGKGNPGGLFTKKRFCQGRTWFPPRKKRECAKKGGKTEGKKKKFETTPKGGSTLKANGNRNVKP